MALFSDCNPTDLCQILKDSGPKWPCFPIATQPACVKMLETTPIFHRDSLMTVEDLKTRLQTELPELLKQDSGFRQWLEQLIRQTAVTPESFDARFDRMLQAFAADREEQKGKWEEHKREWAQHLREWDEHLRESRESREEQNRKWEEHKRDWAEYLRWAVDSFRLSHFCF